MPPSLAQQPDDQQAMWEGYYSSESAYDPTSASPFVAKAYAAFVALGATRVLDLGCGLGHDAIYLAQRGLDVWALDFSHSCLQRLDAAWIDVKASAKGRDRLGEIRCLQADLSQPLPFGNDVFDGVYSNLSLHYFDDATTRLILGEIRRVLRPGGVLAICCKSVDDPLYGQGEKLGPDTFARNGHVRHFFSRTYMCRILSDWDTILVDSEQNAYAQVAGRTAVVWAVARRPM